VLQSAEMGGSDSEQVFDILRQSVLDHIGSMYSVDVTQQCKVVIRKCKSIDADVCVVLSGPRDADCSAISMQQCAPVTHLCIIAMHRGSSYSTLL